MNRDNAEIGKAYEDHVAAWAESVGCAIEGRNVRDMIVSMS